MKKRVWTVTPMFIIFAIIMLVMSGVLFYFSTFVGFVALLVSLVCLFIVILNNLKFKKYISDTLKSADVALGDVTDKLIDQIKNPAVVIGENNDVLVFNTVFKKTFFADSSPLNENISYIISAEDIEESLVSADVEINFGKKIYQVYGRKVLSGILLTFIDMTRYKKIERLFRDTKKSVGIIAFDNIDDFNDATEGETNQITVQVESVLQKWSAVNHIFYRKTYDNRYLVIFDDKDLLIQIEDKFSVLAEIRKIVFSDISASISMGIARGYESLGESQKEARRALEMALGRGGDQVAVLQDGDYKFFGGVSKGIETINNVRVRQISENIMRAIDNSSRVLIMGHKTSDLDCIGGAVGLYCIVKKKYNKPCHIVCDTDRTLAKEMIEHLKRFDEKIFITPEQAMLFAEKETLLFVVDTHSPTFVESKHVLDLCKQVIIIDHHRKMVNAIANPIITFHNPSASSTSELVTDFIKYAGDNYLTKTESEALLAGIMLDTKNFILKSGVATFEAAAFLRKKGANTVEVINMFANSLESYKDKSELVSRAERVNNCAITIEDMNIPNSRAICAQAADDLLTIKGIYASFVISWFSSGVVNISARSYGKINVQLIMEQLGGGGHQTMAATQIKDVTLEQAKQQLIEVLESEEVNS